MIKHFKAIRFLPKKISGTLKLVLILNFLAFGSNVFAQNAISGTITDDNGELMPGVTIVEKGTTNGTISDFDGNYSISVRTDTPVLQFSYVGYIKEEFTVGTNKTIDIELTISSTSLEEVIVIGYGTVQRGDLTGAVSSVDVKAMEDIQFSSLAQTLQGRASGVQVIEASGEPGSAIAIKIRGTNTLSGSGEPLYIIDGIPMNMSEEAAGVSFSAESNPLVGLNPNDIENIEVLKDASATAMYGARAANGVVLITTKQPEQGKVKINFSTTTTLQSAIDPLVMMNAQQYYTAKNGQFMMENPMKTADELDLVNPDTIRVGTDYMDAMLRDAVKRNYRFSITGGSKEISQLFSMNIDRQDGIIVASDFERTNLKYTMNFKPTEKLSIIVDSKLNFTENSRVKTSSKTSVQGALQGATQMNPIIPLNTEAGDLILEDEDGNLVRNAYIDAVEKDDITKNTDMLLSGKVKYKVTDGFVLNGRFGKTIKNSERTVFYPFNTRAGDKNHGKYYKTTMNSEAIAAELFASYNKKIKKHKLSATLGGLMRIISL
tara:strand:- start:17169 stop:18809 length:1641 start_codon:yes stop_codon:yes gene_type:complete